MTKTLPAAPKAKSGRLNFRLSAAQDELIRAGAEAANKSVSEFVLDSAANAATNALLDRRVFVATKKQWQELEQLLERPAVAKPKLAKLLKLAANQ
jgi:uncharacterized protein (DUF1778 family)